MEKIKEALEEKFRAEGYEVSSMNFWEKGHGPKLFINLPDGMSFCYCLNEPYRHTASCRVKTDGRLTPRLFNAARRIGYFVHRHKDEIKEGLA